jgi:hypothetical protein
MCANLLAMAICRDEIRLPSTVGVVESYSFRVSGFDKGKAIDNQS